MPPSLGVGEQHPCHFPHMLDQRTDFQEQEQEPLAQRTRERIGSAFLAAGARWAQLAPASFDPSFSSCQAPGVYFPLLGGCIYVAYHVGLRGRRGDEWTCSSSCG